MSRKDGRVKPLHDGGMRDPRRLVQRSQKSNATPLPVNDAIHSSGTPRCLPGAVEDSNEQWYELNLSHDPRFKSTHLVNDLNST